MEYFLQVSIPMIVLQKVFKCFKSPPFSNSKTDISSDPLCELSFHNNLPYFYLKLNFDNAYLMLQIPTEKNIQLNNKNNQPNVNNANKNSIKVHIYFSELLQTLFNRYTLSQERSVTLSVDTCLHIETSTYDNFMNCEEFTYETADLVEPKNTNFPNFDYDNCEWSFTLNNSNAELFILLLSKLNEHDNERQKNFFTLCLKSNDIVEVYQNEDDDFQINAQFTIDLIKKKESWNFGNYIKFSTCDVSSFLNAFCKGSELTFVFNDLNQMIIDKLLDKELFHFKVQHLFNPIIDNY
jgi:hypothetical protein